MRLKQIVVLAAAVALLSGTAFSGVLTVSKAVQGDNVDAGMFTTIQAAVNAAGPGDVIEIEDAAVYEEQVTIDGRDISPWDGHNGGPVKQVSGGKNGITIRSKNPTGASKPTIKWRDVTNRSPENADEADTPGDMLGSSGNFETCGALRIIRAQGVTLDGIIVDGGGAAPFGWASVWGGKDPLYHGNAAITLVVASGAVIRNCEMKNAYFGVNVKDRNTGGVFGNPNPNDNDHTIPLSGFGKVGNHLIEYNRIHGNSLGFFFESAWDLGSTVRYNLIYNNFHTDATKALMDKIVPEPAVNRACGAMMFKDMVYSPVAIYNNTFYNNYANFYGHWKVGATHLIFNNIYGKSNNAMGVRLDYVDGMGIDNLFPYRMNNCVFAALAELKAEKVGLDGCVNASIVPPIHSPQEVLGITQVRVSNSFSNPTIDGLTTVQCLPPIENQTGTTNRIVPHGSRILGMNGAIPLSANLRWLETSKSIEGTEDLFVSTVETSSDFLRPKWDHPLVVEFLKNKGWMTTDSTTPGAGIRNSDGQPADIGAIPSTGRAPATVARIKPSNVVLVSGSKADANFFITVNEGALNNPKIRFLRWVAPLPDAGEPPAYNWGNQAKAVPSSAIHDITPPTTALTIGNNAISFNIPALGVRDTFGFFELTIEGTDARGNPVTSDVGFLPFRKLEYFLKIEVLHPDGRITTQVKAGEPYRVRVSPLRGTTPFTQGALDAEYQLLSDPTAMMWRQINPEPGNPLVSDGNLTPPSKEYTVYFTKAGEEVIFGSAVFEESKEKRLVFLGNQPITVLPGDPDRVVFSSPIPKSQIPEGALPPVIYRGVPTVVEVEVQDRFGNVVNDAVDVSILSSDRGVADVGAEGDMAVKTVRAVGGVARFIALTGSGAKTGDLFDMTATLVGKGKTDVATLRVGRSLDRLEVFYGDSEDEEGIDGTAGDWHRVTVKAVAGGEVIGSKDGFVCVVPDPGLKLSADDGGSAASAFRMTGGVATFWVSADGDVEGCVNVSMMSAASCDEGDRDYGVNDGNRCDIRFVKPSTDVLNAVVFGDGSGVPDTVLIRYVPGGGASLYNGFDVPDQVTLSWPSGGAGAPTVATVSGDRIAVVDSFTLRADFRGAAGASFPPGYTDISGAGRGLVTVWVDGLDDAFFDVLDGIGPIIADERDMTGKGSPMLVENLDPENVPDTIIVHITEEIDDYGDLEGSSILYVADGLQNNPATGGAPLSVRAAFPDVRTRGVYNLVLEGGGVRPEVGGWIRFNGASGLKDMASSVSGAGERHGHVDNGVHVNNRWVQLTEKQVPPEILSAWYTSSVRTGMLDYAYVTFNKEVNVSSWFTEGYFRFGSGADSAAAGFAPERFLSVVDGDPMTVRVDLREAYPGSQRRIATSGGISVTIGFNAQREWPAMDRSLVDRAKPVLADTVYLRIGAMRDDETGFHPDTLVVTYSEALSDAAVAIPSPVTIHTLTGVSLTPVLSDPVRGSVSGTSFSRISYVIDPGSLSEANFPVTGDLVSIRPEAGLSDGATVANVQDSASNRRVPLKVERGPLKWSVVVKNNPFKGGGPGAEVVMKPSAKGARVEITAKIALYDNVGNLVMETTETGTDLVEWSWSGRNSKGRLAGTGTYLFKAVLTAHVYGSGGGGGAEGRPERNTVMRSIGFVR